MNKCNICQHEYEGMGHNAKPVNDGRCCKECNDLFVLPARIARRMQGLEPYEGSGIINVPREPIH